MRLERRPSVAKLGWFFVLIFSIASKQEDVIPLCVLEQWFGEERLPEGWWDVGGPRPIKQVGLLEARRRAEDVGKIIHDASQWYVFFRSHSIRTLIRGIDSMNACEPVGYFCKISRVTVMSALS